MIIEILTGSWGDSVLFARCTWGDSVLVNKKEWGGFCPGGDFVLHSVISDPFVCCDMSATTANPGSLHW